MDKEELQRNDRGRTMGWIFRVGGSIKEISESSRCFQKRCKLIVAWTFGRHVLCY